MSSGLVRLTEEQRHFAEAHRVARLATADVAGAPHVIPICYALVDDRVYFVVDDKPKRTRTGLRRLRNIADNPRVALVIDDYSDDWSRLAYLLLRGEARIVEQESEFTLALDALRARYSQYDAMDIRHESHPMVRIVPATAHLWRAE